jgi:hypothetical protein
MSDTTTDSPASAATAGEAGWDTRYAAAERSLKHARDFLRVASDEGRIGGREHARYAGIITDAYQEAATQRMTPQARAEAAEAALADIRAQAIRLYQANDICRPGLDDFLENAGLEPY